MPENRSNRSLVDSALSAGLLTTISTGGAIIGLGLREGEISRVFRLVGRGLLEHAGSLVPEAPLSSVALGYLHHIIVATAWGALLGTIVVVPNRGTTRLWLAFGVSVLYGALSLWIIPPLFHIGYAVTSNVVTVVPIVVAMMLALVGHVWIDLAERRGL